jgi:hypothetical protein
MRLVLYNSVDCNQEGSYRASLAPNSKSVRVHKQSVNSRENVQNAALCFFRVTMLRLFFNLPEAFRDSDEVDISISLEATP